MTPEERIAMLEERLLGMKALFEAKLRAVALALEKAERGEHLRHTVWISVVALLISLIALVIPFVSMGST